MRVALVHEWVINPAGSEQCLQAIHEIYPEAPLYTLIFREASLRNLGFELRQVRSSFLQHFPHAVKWYQKYLPLYPIAIESFDLSGYSLIISSSHAVAKGVLTRADQLHICYCHTPMRYAWDLNHEYLRQHRLDRGLKGFLAQLILHYLRIWDKTSAPRVDYFIANSRYTARRIFRAYRRKAKVIYPPVEVERFTLQAKKGDFFLFLSRLVPYKRADLVIRACTRLGLPLVVIGDGPQMSQLRQQAGKNVELMGWQPDEVVNKYLSGARALIFPAEEDFGIVPVEAQACGTPVIAYGRGGLEETVVPVQQEGNWEEATGVFFYEQTEDGLANAIREFIRVEGKFKQDVLRKNAERFGRERFKKEFKDLVDHLLSLRKQTDIENIYGPPYMLDG